MQKFGAKIVCVVGGWGGGEGGGGEGHSRGGSVPSRAGIVCLASRV